MKKILTTIALAGVACGAFAQGTVLFDNNDAGLVTLLTSSGAAVDAIGAGANPGGAVWHVALLFSPTAGGGIAQSALTDIADYTPSATANPGIDGAGFFQDTSAGKEVTITAATTTPGASGTFEVVSWLGTATTWAGALAGGATYETQGANLVEFTSVTANPTAIPPGLPKSINATGWNGDAILTPVPEPTTIALGGLGAAALMLFRRKK
jgi:hypothetical protein